MASPTLATVAVACALLMMRHQTEAKQVAVPSPSPSPPSPPRSPPIRATARMNQLAGSDAAQTARDMSGKTNFELRATIKTFHGYGTIFGRAPALANGAGLWTSSGAGEGKMLFLRRGRLCFDIGWVGFICGKTFLADGQARVVGLQFSNGRYHVTVNGAIEASGLSAVQDRVGDAWIFGMQIGHAGTPSSMATDFVGSIDGVTYASSPYVESRAAKYCSSWGDPHVEQFAGADGRHKTLHTQVKGTFTLFSYLHPTTKQRVSITTVQDKPRNHGPAFNTRVTVTIDANGPNKTVVYDMYAGATGGTAAATKLVRDEHVTVTSSALAAPWPRSISPGSFSEVVTFNAAEGADANADASPAPVVLHIRARPSGSWAYLDVGVEYRGNLSHVDGLCDNSLPPCAEGCSAHEPGVCHCTTPPDLDLTCDVLESCCERAKDPKFPNSPFLGEDYRSCMEDGYHLNGCCEDGANKEDCCAPSIPQDCRIDDYCDCGLGEACNKNTGFCDQKSPRCGPQGTTPSPVTTTAPTTAPAATTAPDAAATATTPLAPAPSPSPPLPEITTTTTAAPVTDGVATTTAAPLVTTSSSTTLRTWEKWSGDFDEMVFSGGTLEDSQNQLVMAFSINTVGGVQATIRSQQTTHTATGQLTASTDTRCPAQPCARLQYTATTAFVGLVDQQGQDKDQHATIVVAAYTHAGALLGKASATASAPCGSSARALAEKQQQALDALEATMKSIVGPMRAMVAQMKAVDVETATLEDESRRLQAALDQASC